MVRYRLFQLLVFLAATVLRGAPATAAEQPAAAPALQLESCRPYGAAADMLCGRLEVPESWQRPDGRKIELAVTVVPARESPAEPPLYHLVGGPGSGTSFWPMVYTGGVEWPIGRVAPGLRRDRDIVLVDHRGAGGSNALHCPALDAFHRIQPTFPLEAVVACRDRLAASPDLTQYSTAAAVRDLEAVREALGHDRLTLFGSSYGTSLALAYMRAHRDRVHAAVLAGVLPLDNRIPLEHAANAERVFERILADCSADAACAQAFPGLRQRWQELLQRLDETPAMVRLTGGEEPRTLEVTRGAFVESLRSRLGMYIDQREIPWLIDEASRGRFEPLVERVTGNDGAYFSMGLYLSAQCPTTLRARDYVESETAGTALGNHRISAQLGACEVWPRVETPATWYEPVEADVPTLLLTGELDHETPPRWAEKVGAELPRSLSVVVPNMGHAWFDAEQECFLGVVDEFLRGADPDALETSCLGENSELPWFLGESDEQAPAG